MSIHTDKTNAELQEELALKITSHYKDEQSFIDYMLETKRSFLHRYLETTLNKDIAVVFLNNQFVAESFESNMGEAFKSTDKEIKEGVKHLAKNIDRTKNPKVRYQLKTTVNNLKSNQGLITIEAQANWGFPNFEENKQSSRTKVVEFRFADANIFRKELALNYEKACELFL